MKSRLRLRTPGHAKAPTWRKCTWATRRPKFRGPKELKGFVKVNLRPGETKKVSVILDSRALSYYDVDAKQWRADPGDFDVLVGRSSEQIELRGKLTLTSAVAGK